ncbi:hypothetical protein OSTOST_11035, partial [Ostertagia ostertagi]
TTHPTHDSDIALSRSSECPATKLFLKDTQQEHNLLGKHDRSVLRPGTRQECCAPPPIKGMQKWPNNFENLLNALKKLESAVRLYYEEESNSSRGVQEAANTVGAVSRGVQTIVGEQEMSGPSSSRLVAEVHRMEIERAKIRTSIEKTIMENEKKRGQLLDVQTQNALMEQAILKAKLRMLNLDLKNNG